ncbi:MAG: hypothetical protein AAF355_14280 [Myxococcota bacterium]
MRVLPTVAELLFEFVKGSERDIGARGEAVNVRGPGKALWFEGRVGAIDRTAVPSPARALSDA